MRRLELTCDLCKRLELLPADPARLMDPSHRRGWKTIPVKGDDMDICQPCWSKIIQAVAQKLPLEMKA